MPVGLVVAAVGLGIQIYQGVQAKKEKEEARELAENYVRQDIPNPYLGIDKYPTQAIQLRKEANERELAANVNIAARSGRGLSVMSGASAVYQRKSRETAADIEKYQYERSKLIAEGEKYKTNLQEQRERDDIAGIGQLGAVADQNMNNAIVGSGNALAQGAQIYADRDKVDKHGTTDMNAGVSKKAKIKDTEARTNLVYGSLYNEGTDIYSYG